jgi:hypothetical protein
LISDYWNSAIVGRRNPASAGVWQHPVAGILPATSGHRRWMLAGQISAMVRSRPDLDKFGHWSGLIWPKWLRSGQIWPNLAIDPEESDWNSAKIARWNPATAAFAKL